MTMRSCSARVLVIDNDSRVGEDLREMLEPLGYHVAVAQGVGHVLQKHARELASTFRPHVAVVDVRLFDEYGDDRSGLVLLQCLRSSRCILYSAYLTPDVTLKARVYADSWVSKSKSPQQLVDAVADAARRTCAAHKNLTIRPAANWTSERIIETLFEPQRDIPAETVNDLLGQLFPDSDTVTLETLDGAVTTPGSVSRGRSVLFKAWRNNKKEPLVVKLAPAHRIEQEGQNYTAYIQDNLRGLFHARLEGDPVIFWDLGGVLYSFVGVASERLPSFATFYQTETKAEAILRPLQHLFTRVWSDLYADGTKVDESLFDAYSGSLRLDQRLAEWPKQTGTLSLSGVPVDLDNPLDWVLKHKQYSVLPRTRQAITHGDLHGDNLFVEGDNAWAIDFERSGPGPILRDFVELEVDIFTRLAALPQENLFDAYELAVELVDVSAPNLSHRPPVQIEQDPERLKALTVIKEIRDLAYEITHFSDFREYLWGLLLDAVFVITSTEAKSPQHTRALLLGAIVCERLRRWGQQWPPHEWLSNGDPALETAIPCHQPAFILREILEMRFSDSELRTLCYDLNVDYDTLPGQGFADKPRELIKYLERRQQLDSLFAAGKRLRDDIPWDDLRKTRPS